MRLRDFIGDLCAKQGDDYIWHAYSRFMGVAIGFGALPALAADTGADNGWDRKLFDYQRPEKLVVKQKTPSDSAGEFLDSSAADFGG